MTTHDVILRLVELLLIEKDKNTELQLKFQLEKLSNDDQTNKD